MIVLNLKNYDASLKSAVDFVGIAKKVSSESGVRIPVAVPFIHLRQAAKEYKDIFAQHVDDNKPGPFTGSMPAEAVKIAGACGSLLNHSERKVPFEKIKVTVERMNELKLETVICAESQEEVLKIGRLKSKYIAIEPPELIGSGISVSNARPQVIEDAVKTVATINGEMQVLCGAGIGSKEDVRKSLELGAKGVLLASAFVNAKSPAEFLRSLASGF